MSFKNLEIEDFTGKIFTYLTVLYRYKNEKGDLYNSWMCECKCGNSIRVNHNDLQKGRKKSCGCIKYQRANRFYQDTEYPIWRKVLNDKKFSIYEPWKEYKKFIADVGRKPNNAAFRKKDLNKGFSIDNFVWLPNNSMLSEEYKIKTSIKNAKAKIEIKEEFIKEYGGECVCCKEDRFEFLTIDHIKGRTNVEHTKAFQELKRLKALNWPKDNIQILCWNCNSAKGIYGVCPHNWPKNERRVPNVGRIHNIEPWIVGDKN